MLKTLMPSINELINADYQKIRTSETEQLIETMLKGVKPVEHPELKQISGIPGSGKSTFCSLHLPTNFLLISFDKIMLSLSGYQKALKQQGAVAAYSQYEMPARIIGYELLYRAIAKKINIMFEHSGTNKAHLELFQNLNKCGYKTTVDFIVCDTSLAINRTKQREKQINRHVPENIIKERAQNFDDYIKAYQKIASSIAVFDGANNFQPLKKI